MIKSDLRFNKPKSKLKSNVEKTTSPLPPNLQIFKEKILSRNGFRVNKWALKFSKY